MRAALEAGFGLGTPSAAEGPCAQRARINALGSAGKYAQAIPLAKAMLANLGKGPPTKDLAGALNTLAQLDGEVGRDAEAEPRFKRALAITERVLGLESVDIAIELNNLAALCQREQRYAEVEPLLKRAQALSERSRPANHPAIARALNNLATNYEKPGRHDRVRSADRARARDP